MPAFIRLTDYKNSEEKEKGFFEEKNRYVANQEDFFKIPRSPIAYWVSDRIREIFKDTLKNYGNFGEGLSTKNNDLFVRIWNEVDLKKIGFNISSSKDTFLHKYFPFHKGGEFRRWYGNYEYVVNYKNNAIDLKKYKKSQLKNSNYYFKLGLTWSKISSSKFSVRLSNIGNIYSDAGLLGILIDNYLLNYTVALLNSNLTFYLLKILNPTLNYTAGSIENLPFKMGNYNYKQKIDQLTEECINISKEEWDSRETSWDFKASPLIENGEGRVENGRIEDVYNAYCEYWREKFYKLHKNEEELNKLFIEIYGLEDELTLDVPLEDITILKKEAKIENNELVFDKKEIIKQFISYFVGVLFGRYSLDKEGLILANLGENLEDYLKQIPNPTFLPDDDNIVPILDREYFEDDIVSRFKEFVKKVFGEEYFSENMKFIEEAIGDIRKYFNKEFYKDHIQRYKKRPIYWMITSKNGAFKALIYMHRFYPDIFARVRNEYLLELIAKIESRISSLDKRLEIVDSKEKKQIEKEIVKLNKELKELYEFDKILQKYANQTFDIDLDDGVKANYCKFKEILYPISNLCK